jgi:hypothetical protein
MDTNGFLAYLERYKLSEEQTRSSVEIAQDFDSYLNTPGRIQNAETAWAFSKQMIADGKNTETNYITLIRYCRFIKNNEMFVALLELVDGGEVGGNFYRLVGESFGKEVQAQVFSGTTVIPLGTPTPEKPAFIHPLIAKLKTLIGEKPCRDFLSAGLRDLPDEYFFPEKEKYEKSADMDEFLRQRKVGFLAELEKCQQEGRLFFAQEITSEVVEFVRSQPEMGGGVRRGNIIYETKIPFLTKQYLAETDPEMKRYYACHCPWVREAVRNKDVQIDRIFCNCSGGFHKKPFEVIFGQPLTVDVLETVLDGGDRCRFAIHLPGNG